MSLTPTHHELTECDREPIHNIAYVQSFGGLIKVTADWLVAHRSVNCTEILGLTKLPEPGTPLGDVFSPQAMEALQAAVSRLSHPDAVERLFGVALVSKATLFDCAVHKVSGRLIIEFERNAGAAYNDHLGLISPMLSQFRTIREPQALFENATRLVRDMLGYDRVMIYKFHHDDSGEVVAEAKDDALEPLLGLRYPRTDIPQQARELFKRNRFRVIANVDDELSPIEPPMSLGNRPIDMSMSVLRASSQIHLSYMKNMGVKASLTIAIVRQDKLWGLISCHHNSPRLPPFSLRTVAEMFSQMFSLMLDRMLIDRSEQQKAKGRALHDDLILRLADGKSLFDSLPALENMLSEAIEHDGLSMLIDGQYRSVGIAPSAEQMMQLVPMLTTALVGTVICSNELASEAPEAGTFADIAAGAMILPVSRNPRDYLILWRKPLSQKVTWAGDPAKAVKAPAGDRLQPRESFAAWEQTVEGRCEEWSEDDIQIAEGLRVSLLEVVLRMTDQVARERARAQEQQELLIAELNHRVRNILNLIRSLISQSQEDATTVSAFANIIGGRISALATAHDNITRENWSPAPLSALLNSEVSAYLNNKEERFELSGEDALIVPEAYSVLALVLHELVTNSAKYGALCDRSGRVTVELSRNEFNDLVIEWREIGGPPVRPPQRRGFGSTIIEQSIPHELKGVAKLRFILTGLEADFVIPCRYLAQEDKPRKTLASSAHDADNADHEAGIQTNGGGLPGHVLLVEDSIIIAMDTEQSLKRIGIETIAVEGSVKGALRALQEKRPDFAIVDFNLGKENSEPIAAALNKQGVPFALATGYAEMTDQIERLGAQALLRKPYGRSEIEDLLIESP